MLSQIRDSIANDWLLAQTNPDPNLKTTTDIVYTAGKVTQVTLPAHDAGVNTDRPQKTYNYTSAPLTTKVTVAGLAGIANTVTYDAGWKQLSSTTAMGVSATSTWDATKDLLLATVNSFGLKSTTIYDPATDRATDTSARHPLPASPRPGYPSPTRWAPPGAESLPGTPRPCWTGA